MNTYEKRTVCPYDCPDACGMIAVTDGEKILSVRGDEAHPVTKGILCRKMQRYEQDIHSPHRILTPLKRVGKKGAADSFVPISWKEAVSEIGARWREIIQTYGAESILPYSYAGNMGIINRNCGDAFFARLGAARLIRTICSSAREAGVSSVMENLRDRDSADISDANLILLWGSNPLVNRLHVVPRIKEAKRKGAKVILIDVYRNASSSLADDVLLVRPGTDAALLLAVMAQLEQSGQLDMDFIAGHTTGYEELRAQWQDWSVEKASAETSIPAGQIAKLAKIYGAAKRPLIIAGSGMSRYANGAAAFRLLLCLPAVTGAWKRGGGTAGFMGSGEFIDKSCIQRPDWVKPGTRRINMNQLGNALLDQTQPIRSLYVYHSNPAVMTPDQQKVWQGLSRNDLFLVVHDRFLTDTALMADLVLPATFSVEQDDLFSCYGHYHLQVSRQVIPPAGEAKSNWDTFCLLAKEMGFTDEFFKQTVGEMMEKILDVAVSPKTTSDSNNDICRERACNDNAYANADSTSMPYNLLKISLPPDDIQKLRDGYAVKLPQPDVLDIQTADKKIHLALSAPAYTPLPDQKYPLRLVMVHSPWSLNSNFSYRKELMEKRGPLRLRIHPSEAAARSIADKELVFAYNDYGKITVQIETTEDVPHGTAIAEGVYQKEYTYGNGNFSSLLSQKLTDAGEASTLNTQTVELCKQSNKGI